MKIMESLVSRELFATLHRQFRWRHPGWFDVANYRAATKKEAKKIARLREQEREKNEEMR